MTRVPGLLRDVGAPLRHAVAAGLLLVQQHGEDGLHRHPTPRLRRLLARGQSSHVTGHHRSHPHSCLVTHSGLIQAVSDSYRALSVAIKSECLSSVINAFVYS